MKKHNIHKAKTQLPYGSPEERRFIFPSIFFLELKIEKLTIARFPNLLKVSTTIQQENAFLSSLF